MFAGFIAGGFLFLFIVTVVAANLCGPLSAAKLFGVMCINGAFELYLTMPECMNRATAASQLEGTTSRQFVF
jgi:hypothetical protein